MNYKIEILNDCILNYLREDFPENSESLYQEIQIRFSEISKDIQFISQSKNPIDKRIELAACFLALMKTMDAAGMSYATIREFCLKVVTELVRPKSQWESLKRKLPAKLIKTWIGGILISLIQHKAKFRHPDGFSVNIVTDKMDTYQLGFGIDILECGICKLYHKHQFDDYAKILCEVDEMTSMMAGLQLVRKGTIANGAHKCDFRFQPL
ncbi:MAG: L-2-amino-thiazoline-4-carboxylic acid hydrolase [Saprospiraceae bacterium]|nr:L-2-amino-thiazoline-4-carboxylic acid hydrolase [Saprospiraceae bacterium]MBK7811015.1 L-2-amino-thiazoline-4-carboxylic acid hydrolase [Saprospiraceae bacterium]